MFAKGLTGRPDLSYYRLARENHTRVERAQKTEVDQLMARYTLAIDKGWLQGPCFAVRASVARGFGRHDSPTPGEGRDT